MKNKFIHYLSEKDIQNQIINYLELKKIFHWRQNVGGMKYEYFDKNLQKLRLRYVRFGSSGTSDILGIYKGKPFAIEVKSLKGKLNKYQKNFLTNFYDNGGIAIVARKLEDVSDIIK